MTKLTDLDGVGEKTASRLAALGVESAEGLLYFLPRAYQDRSNPQPIPTLNPGQFATVRGQVLSISERRYRTRRVLEAMITDGKGVLVLKWFRFGKWLRKNIEGRFPPGSEALASGRVDAFGGQVEMHHPDLTSLEAGDGVGLVPVYSVSEGLSQQLMRKAVGAAVKWCIGKVSEYVPGHILEKYGLPDLPESLAALHQPPRDADVGSLNEGTSRWHNRLKFGELLVFQLGLLARRRELDSRTAPVITGDGSLERSFLGDLPFELTGAQERSTSEIRRDLASGTPMHRLLQGDVGSGKTLVAFLAMLRAAEDGRQSVLMAPTEVLAGQHYRNLSAWCEKLGMEVALLTGSMDAEGRRRAVGGAGSGEIKLFVGTHAIIQEGVQFKDLALAVVDEQHRFGVLQRLALREKGTSPHFLVMTATPIPRSLTMVIYGDLDISTIDELPPGRTPVETVIYKERDRSRMYLRVSREAGRGRQVYIVYPLVEESEKVELLAANEMAREYRERIFPHLRIGLLTGRMAPREKAIVMDRFRQGKDQVLVSTTVIEVGVDVPNATLMVIEHAERFGLFQLHQLRGRVGRGHEKSTCILMEGSSASPEARARLEVLVSTDSGFTIADADLRIRGPGDFLGSRQSGMPDFMYAHPLRDSDIMAQAREAAGDMAAEGRIPDFLHKEIGKFWIGSSHITYSG
ncbi:MAG: ATP-dependent DNA helicase RecG [bacterium]|nr:ATP-dependent DNA helicase RecG [bacterium]